MHRVAVSLAALLASTLLSAQTESRSPSAHEEAATAAVRAPDTGDELGARAATLIEAALERGAAWRLLEELVTVAPHRLSGSEGAATAVAWAEATMRRIGLENVRLEPVLVPRWERGALEEAVVLPGDGDAAEGTPLTITALGGSVPTPDAGITAPVLMVRGIEQLQALGPEAARGRIVFFNRPMPRALANTFHAYGQAVPQRTSGPVEAARAGAVAVLVRSMTTAIDDFPHTGSTVYRDGVPPIPAAAISTLDAEALAERIDAGETLTVRLRLSCHTLPDVESANVVGEIVGTERPDEIVLIGGHLDAWDLGQGAHDDGAGCVHCLEAARLLLAEGVRPRRTIRVVLFMNEENGLRGARAYAAAHADEFDRHVAAIESDAGGFQPLGFTTTATGEARERYQELLQHLRPYGMGSLFPGGGGADISVLRSHGVPLFGLSPVGQRYFDHHHSARDTIDAVNERELAHGAAALAWLAAALADA